MTLAKISFSKLYANLASVNLAIKMDDQEVKGASYFHNRITELEEAIYPDKSISVATLVLNVYAWGQEYQKSLPSDKERMVRK